ncbi:MAG: hypothetical protein ACXWTL_11120 [Methylobacter sp.]
MIKLTRKFLVLLALLSLVLLSACAEVKDAGKTIGHTTRNVTREIGHGTRDVTRTIGHGTRDTVKAIGKGTKEVVKSVTDDGE